MAAGYFYIVLFRHVRQKRDLTRSLDSLGELALMLGACPGRPAGKDLAALRNITAELCSVLIINMLTFIYAELANFFTFAVIVAASWSAVSVSVSIAVHKLTSYRLIILP